MQDAKKNAKIAGVEDSITFINLDVLSSELHNLIPEDVLASFAGNIRITGLFISMDI